MSGRVAPQDVVAALYRAVDDDRLPWLDELLIAAGFLRSCPCGATAPAEHRCDRCGHSDDHEPDVVDYFELYRCDPEVTFDIPTLARGDTPLQIRIAAAGGGTVGAAYADNDWIYDVRLAGTLICSGADLHSGGIARTHAQMAVVLAEHLADTDQVPALRRHRERLSLWANDTKHGGGRDG
jgi:hypothetical protein